MSQAPRRTESTRFLSMISVHTDVHKQHHNDPSLSIRQFFFRKMFQCILIEEQHYHRPKGWTLRSFTIKWKYQSILFRFDIDSHKQNKQYALSCIWYPTTNRKCKFVSSEKKIEKTVELIAEQIRYAELDEQMQEKST